MIGTLNTSKRLFSEIEKICSDKGVVELNSRTDMPNIDGLFVDWVSTTSASSSALLQLSAMKKYTGKIPMVVFDRYMVMKTDETKWLSERKAHLFEPCILTRNNFEYMPFHIDTKTIDEIDEDTKIRKSDLHYKGILSDRREGFEKYYSAFSSMYSPYIVTQDSDLERCSVEKKSLSYSNVKCSLFIDTYENYNRGYIDPNIFECLNMGCVPLIPIEHKYYHALFKDTIVKDIRDIKWLISLYDSLSFGVIVDIHRKIDSMFTEMKTENIAEKICSLIM